MLSLITWSIFMVLECSSNKKNLSPLWMSTFFPLSYMKCFSSAVCIGSKVQWQLMSWTVNTGLQVEHTTEEELDENTTLTRQDHRFLTQNWNKKKWNGVKDSIWQKMCLLHSNKPTRPIRITSLSTCLASLWHVYCQLQRDLRGRLVTPSGWSVYC